VNVFHSKKIIFASLAAVALVGGSLVTMASAASPANVNLGSAVNFAILAGSGVTNTGSSLVSGDLGLSPGTSFTGFPPGTVVGTQHITDPIAAQAQLDLSTAFGQAAGSGPTIPVASDLGGKTLSPGVYKDNGAPNSLSITGTLTLDGGGDANAVFIFQAASTLVTATDSVVKLINGAQADNVFWQLGTSATLGATSIFKGNILAHVTIAVNNAANIEGRLLAQIGQVTLINDVISKTTIVTPTPTVSPVPTPSPTPTVSPVPTASPTPIVTLFHEALPVRLLIPRIKVNAPIEFVGLTSSGLMDVPKKLADVAWYKFGPRPGDLGNAVISGHRGRPHLTPIVFDNLYKVRKGDLVNVRESDGRVITFVVRSTHIYSANASAPEVFGSTSGSHLNLVTCIWNNSKRAFDKRLVVFTDRQSGYSAALSTVLLGANGTNPTVTPVTTSSAAKALGTQNGVVLVSLKDTAGAAYTGQTVTATMSGVGFVGGTSATYNAVAATFLTNITAAKGAATLTRTVAVTDTTGYVAFGIWGDGTAGAGTVTISVTDKVSHATTVLGTKTVNFYGAIGSITPTVNPYLGLLAIGVAGATNNNAGAITLVVKDANGVTIPAASALGLVYANSGTPAVIADAYSSALITNIAGVLSYNPTGVAAGTAAITFTNGPSLAASTVTSAATTLTVAAS
jgi:LPXTG-site transpeptidase (sortase) family protein